jgi:hypothetical protein
MITRIGIYSKLAVPFGCTMLTSASPAVRGRKAFAAPLTWDVASRAALRFGRINTAKDAHDAKFVQLM